MFNSLKSAFITLTRIPFIKVADKDFNLKNGLWAFPLVGFVLACILSCAILIFKYMGLPDLIGAILIILLLMLLTGALHEDGLADCADGFGASTAERRLEIMRDSQIGVYGTLALMFSVLIRATALYYVWRHQLVFEAIFVSLFTSRGAMVMLPFFTRPARDNGIAAHFTNIEPKQLFVAQIMVLVGGFLLVDFDIFYIAIISLIVTYIIAKVATQKIGGFTGDVLGATEQLVQIMCFLTFLALH